MKTKEEIKFIDEYLHEKYLSIGIDKPENHQEILEFIVDNVNETADPTDWHSGDIDIAFRRFLESKEITFKQILYDIRDDLFAYKSEDGIGMLDDNQWADLFIERVSASIESFESYLI